MVNDEWSDRFFLVGKISFFWVLTTPVHNYRLIGHIFAEICAPDNQAIQQFQQFNNQIIMSNPSQATPTTTVKKKKKKPATNWKQILIISVMVLAAVSMVAPGIFSWIGNLARRGDSYPSASSNSTTGTTSTTTAPSTTNTEAMPEPKFQKEGELYFQSVATGKAISKIDIEKADTEVDRQFGLMFRKSMPEEQGMLFLFETNERQSFWMRNTYIPLDIIFVDENGVINTIHENAKPLSDASLASNGNAKYVVEVIGGYTKKHGIKVGDKISWQ